MDLSFYLHSVGEHGVSPWWLVAAGLVIAVLVWLWRKYPPGDLGEVNVRANFEFSTRPAAKRSPRAKPNPPSAALEKPE